jgi:hypothetical protein
MKDNVVEVWVLRVSVSFPVSGVYMQFDIALINFSIHLDGGTGEVGSFAEIPVSGIHNFQILIVFGLEGGRTK